MYVQYVCMYVCMYICMYLCMYVCIMYVCMYVLCMYVCMYVCMYLCITCMCVCIHVCMYLIADDESDSPTVQDGCMESECLIGDEENGGWDATTVLSHKVCCVCVGGWA